MVRESKKRIISKEFIKVHASPITSNPATQDGLTRTSVDVHTYGCSIFLSMQSLFEASLTCRVVFHMTSSGPHKTYLPPSPSEDPIRTRVAFHMTSSLPHRTQLASLPYKGSMDTHVDTSYYILAYDYLFLISKYILVLFGNTKLILNQVMS